MQRVSITGKEVCFPKSKQGSTRETKVQVGDLLPLLSLRAATFQFFLLHISHAKLQSSLKKSKAKLLIPQTQKLWEVLTSTGARALPSEI